MDNPDNGNIGYKRHRRKTNKTKNTPQKTKRVRKRKLVPAFYKTPPCQSYSQDTLDTTLCKQTQIRHKPSHKELRAKTNRTSPPCEHHNTTPRTQRHKI